MNYRERPSRTAAVGAWQSRFPDGYVNLPNHLMIARQVLSCAPASTSPCGYSWPSIRYILELHYGWHSFEYGGAIKGSMDAYLAHLAHLAEPRNLEASR
jgi:hypothetical protein